MKATATMHYGPLSFSMELEGKKVAGYSETVFSLAELKKLETAAARWIVEHGAVYPETLRLLRGVAGLSQTQLAELLDSDKETISRWENGHRGFAPGTWQTVAQLALDAIELRDGMKRRLEAARTAQAAKKLPPPIMLKAG